MTEREIYERLNSLLTQTRTLPIGPERSHFNETYRLLIELHCPRIVEDSYLKLQECCAQVYVEDDAIPGVSCMGCED